MAEVGYDEPLYYCLVQVGQPSVTIYAFQARVDAVVHTGEAILASGDKGVSAFHVDTGEFLGKTSIRDTSAIPTLFITGHSLWTCSRNGAIREWSLPHDVRNIEFRCRLSVRIELELAGVAAMASMRCRTVVTRLARGVSRRRRRDVAPS